MLETRAFQVGFIGLGDIGAPMARRLVEQGWPLTVWARRREAAEAVSQAGAVVAANPAELASRCGLVGLCVIGGDDVVEVIDALRPGLRPGSIVVIHSTVAPAVCRELADGLADAGVDVLDAPISGGSPRAAAGTLSVMVGGAPDVFERARPVLSSLGNAELIGPLGSGQVMKLLNNAMLMAQLELACQAVEAAAGLGIDAELAERLLQAGSGASVAMQSRIRFRELDIDHVRHMLAKDHTLFGRAVDGRDLAGSITRLGDELLERMASREWA
jgi:3-hydroxyisobutyrate dehydrogenase-like beta-hydroxyacid dehydrogenase